jgi:hypothetical protein
MNISKPLTSQLNVALLLFGGAFSSVDTGFSGPLPYFLAANANQSGTARSRSALIRPSLRAAEGALAVQGHKGYDEKIATEDDFRQAIERVHGNEWSSKLGVSILGLLIRLDPCLESFFYYTAQSRYQFAPSTRLRSQNSAISSLQTASQVPAQNI